MLLVLDTNQYLFAFGLLKKPSCESLIDILKDKNCGHTIRIPRLIVDEDFFVPFDIGSKYESLGLKPADAFIAAYTEWISANILVTENRHFLTSQSNLPFKVLTAEKCLKILAK